MTTLLLIEGKLAHRYVGGKRVDTVEMDPVEVTLKEFRSNLEHYRLNGLAPAVIRPADVAFDRIAHELQEKAPPVWENEQAEA
jgi:hypothetical protein